MRSVEVRVHHQSLPANCRARFLKVDAHDDHDPIRDLLGQGRETAGVVATALDIVNRTRANDEEEAFIVGEDQPVDFSTRVGDKLGLGGGFWHFGQ
jgi:hypothetical protein